MFRITSELEVEQNSRYREQYHHPRYMIEVADVRLDGSRQSKEYTEVQAVICKQRQKSSKMMTMMIVMVLVLVMVLVTRMLG